LRGQVLEALLSRPAWQKLLLGAIDKKVVPANDIDVARRERLLNHRDASLRQQAAKAFAGALNTDRQKVLDSHRDVLKMTGDSLRGNAVFVQHCAACHALDGVGHSVGPDLAALAGKSPEYFLQEILDPSRNLDSRFVQYLAVTKNGQVFSGLMASESAVSITLKGPDGKESSVLRADLEELATAGKSLMPDGLEMNLTKQALADLLAYLTLPRTTR
jgi:putative heme-binding domain-containing protein